MKASPSLTPGDSRIRCPCCGATAGVILLERADFYGLSVAIRCVESPL